MSSEEKCIEYIEKIFDEEKCNSDKKKKKVLKTLINSFGDVLEITVVNGKLIHNFYRLPKKYKHLIGVKK